MPDVAVKAPSSDKGYRAASEGVGGRCCTDDMDIDDVISETEDELRRAAADLTAVRPAECLLCYVHRMLELGCTGLRWAQRYRDLRAPRATALERRLGQRGGFCDCEIFLNGYTLAHDPARRTSDAAR